MKVFALSDATNGYVYRIKFTQEKNIKETPTVGLFSRMVLDLMSGLNREGINCSQIIITQALNFILHCTS